MGSYDWERKLSEAMIGRENYGKLRLERKFWEAKIREKILGS
jgi:hypothetical protein